MMYSQGDILLVPLPFTDLSSQNIVVKRFGKVKLETIEKTKFKILEVMGNPS